MDLSGLDLPLLLLLLNCAPWYPALTYKAKIHCRTRRQTGALDYASGVHTKNYKMMITRPFTLSRNTRTCDLMSTGKHPVASLLNNYPQNKSLTPTGQTYVC